jgi:hypothetical protein
MTQDEIIEMARQAGFIDADWNIRIVLPHLEAFAKLVAQHEREACAKVCDDLWEDDGTAYECAEAIRARGQA